MDVDRLEAQALRRTGGQYLLDQRRDTVDALQDKAAILLGARVGAQAPRQQLGRALDSGQRVLDLVREPSGRQLEIGLRRTESLRGASMERMVVQQHYRAMARALRSQ